MGKYKKFGNQQGRIYRAIFLMIVLIAVIAAIIIGGSYFGALKYKESDKKKRQAKLAEGVEDVYVLVRETNSYNGDMVEYQYDNAGHLIQKHMTHDSDDSVTDYEYVYDEKGNKIQDIYKDGEESSVTDYKYDESGNLLGSTGNITVTCSYDERGNLIREDFGYATTDYTYDENDILIRKVSSYGEDYTYEYENGNLYKEILYSPNGRSEWSCTLMTYDEDDNLLTQDSFMLASKEECLALTKDQAGTGWTSARFEYEEGLKVREYQTYKGMVDESSYKYDKHGNLIERTTFYYSEGETAADARDEMSQFYEYQLLSDLF